MAPRPVIAALGEQQKVIDAQTAMINKQSEVIQAQAEMVDRLVAGQRNLNARVAMMGRGLQTLSSLAGSDVVQRVTASMSKTADEQNPAQPVIEPPAQPAAFSTEETEMPEAFADVTAPGLAPGTTQDVAPDAVSTVYTPGTDVDMPALNNLIDVTTPVDGTQNPRPLEEVKTHTDVRVGDPMNAQTAFPLQGPWQNAQRTSSRKQASAEDIAKSASNRTMASLHLAKLRLATGTAEGEQYTVAAEIEKDASLSTEAIQREITTLENVAKAASRKASAPSPEQARGLVPRTASTGTRAVPSMQSTGANTNSANNEDDASDLFD